MTTKRTSLVAGAFLGGTLLLGTVGFVMAQDPTTSPSAAATPGMSGGMMGGQGMDGELGQGMMAGQGMGGQGMGGHMAGGQMSDMGSHMAGGQMSDMATMHAAMGHEGTCDAETMESMHEQHESNR